MSTPEDLYDELSRMLQLYRRKIEYCEKLLHRFAHQFFDEKDTSDVREYLSALFLQEMNVVDRYLQQHFSNRSLKMVLYRFFSRIVEIIRNQRARIRSKVHATLSDYFDSVENLIFTMVSSTGGVLLDGLLSFYDRSQDYAVELIGIMEEKNKRNAGRPVPPKLVIEQPPLRINVPNPEVELPSPAKTVQTVSDESPRKNPPKLMEGLRVLDCLDLDTGNFRSTYLYCKHHSTIIEEQTSQRNQLIAQEIKAYKKAYADYQVRRAKRAQHLRIKRQSGNHQEPTSPLQAIGQSSVPTTKRSRHSRLVEKEYSSVRRMDPQAQLSGYIFKENNSTGFIDATRTMGGFNKSPKPNLSPKKVLLCFNKLSLRPVDELNKTSMFSNSKKKSRTRSSNRRLGDSFEMLIQGQRIRDNKEADLRRSNYKIVSQKTFTSNLFAGIN